MGKNKVNAVEKKVKNRREKVFFLLCDHAREYGERKSFSPAMSV